jgi:hypothetical protein
MAKWVKVLLVKKKRTLSAYGIDCAAGGGMNKSSQ